jgi:hypothetical protein
MNRRGGSERPTLPENTGQEKANELGLSQD